MQVWAALQFACALAVVVSCLALIIGKLHVIERAEEQKFWRETREKITKMQQPRHGSI